MCLEFGKEMEKNNIPYLVSSFLSERCVDSGVEGTSGYSFKQWKSAPDL